MKAEYDLIDAKPNPYIEKLRCPDLDTCAIDYFKRDSDRTKDDNLQNSSLSQPKELIMSKDMIVVSRKPIHPGEFLREDYSRTLIGVEFCFG